MQVTKPHSQYHKQKEFGEYPHTLEAWECIGWIQGQLDLGADPPCRGTFGGRRKAVRDRFALQGVIMEEALLVWGQQVYETLSLPA